MSYEDKLRKLDIVLPDAPSPLGTYVPCVRSGKQLFVSGMLPLKDGKLLCTGRVGKDISVETAQKASQQALINALAVVKSNTGSLDKIVRCIKLNGYIASDENFFEQPKVINAASDLLFKIFGENGRHARAAIGVSALPLNSPVEIDFIFEIND